MADTKIDKSLDDIIKENRGKFGGGRGRGGAGGNRGMRGAGGSIQKRRSAGLNASLSPNKAAASINGQWNHDLYQNGKRGGAGAAAAAALVQPSSGPAKIVISNLDFGVNDADIQGLFAEFGTIRKAAVHYDRSGRSLGTADVLFDRKQDAIRALTHYNGVSLDGRPMNIQLTASLSAPRIMPPPRSGSSNGGGGGARRGGAPTRGSGGAGGGQRRGGRGGRGGQRGGGAAKTPKSAADLDADLEAYSAKMQTD